jgi:hypothetical protein
VLCHSGLAELTNWHLQYPKAAIPGWLIYLGHIASSTRQSRYDHAHKCDSPADIPYPQAFASLKALQPQIDEIHKSAEDWDVPTPVLDALRSVLIGQSTIPTETRGERLTRVHRPSITKQILTPHTADLRHLNHTT